MFVICDLTHIVVVYLKDIQGYFMNALKKSNITLNKTLLGRNLRYSFLNMSKDVKNIDLNDKKACQFFFPFP